MRRQIGAWGKTIFAILNGGGRATLELQQRQGDRVHTVHLDMAEICAIAGLADALGFDYEQYSGVMKARLERD